MKEKLSQAMTLCLALYAIGSAIILHKYPPNFHPDRVHEECVAFQDSANAPEKWLMQKPTPGATFTYQGSGATAAGLNTGATFLDLVPCTSELMPRHLQANAKFTCYWAVVTPGIGK